MDKQRKIQLVRPSHLHQERPQPVVLHVPEILETCNAQPVTPLMEFQPAPSPVQPVSKDIPGSSHLLEVIKSHTVRRMNSQLVMKHPTQQLCCHVEMASSETCQIPDPMDLVHAKLADLSAQDAPMLGLVMSVLLTQILCGSSKVILPNVTSMNLE